MKELKSKQLNILIIYINHEKNIYKRAGKKIGEQLGITWKEYDVEQFRMGMNVELEHGTVNSNTNVTDDNPLMTGKIALAHLNELPDYYTILAELERQGEEAKLKK